MHQSDLELFLSSLELGQQVLEALGVPPDVAVDRHEQVRQHDERILREQHLVCADEAALIASSEQARRAEIHTERFEPLLRESYLGSRRKRASDGAGRAGSNSVAMST